MRATVLRVIIVLIWLILAVIPAAVFFSTRGGLAFLQGDSFQELARGLFPLFGLYAFFLIWTQIMVGSNMGWLRRLFPGVLTWHRTEGLVAFVFAMIHPLLLVVGEGLDRYFSYSFVAPDKRIYVWLGYVQLILLTVAVLSALLRRQRWWARHWRKVHILNYVVFALVVIHSWNLGSDTRGTLFTYVIYFFVVTYLVSLALRLRRAFKVWQRKKAAPTESPTQPPDQPYPPHQPL